MLQKCLSNSFLQNGHHQRKVQFWHDKAKDVQRLYDKFAQSLFSSTHLSVLISGKNEVWNIKLEDQSHNTSRMCVCVCFELIWAMKMIFRKSFACKMTFSINYCPFHFRISFHISHGDLCDLNCWCRTFHILCNSKA